MSPHQPTNKTPDKIDAAVAALNHTHGQAELQDIALTA